MNVKDRVVIVLADGDKLYGTETAVLRLIKSLNRSKHFSVCSIKSSLHSEFQPWQKKMGGNAMWRLIKLCLPHSERIIISASHHASVALLILSFLSRKKIICWEHSEHDFAKPFMQYIKRFFYRFAFAIVVVNEKDKAYWSKVNDNVIKIWNLSGNKHASDQQKNIDILYIGRFAQERGKHYFNDIFTKLSHLSAKKFNITLIGDSFEGLEHQHFKNHNIEIIPYSSEPEKDHSRSHCYINPANYESFGLSVYEALLCGSTVVAWDHTASAREFINEKGFKPVKPGDIHSFADTIVRAIDSQKTCRTKNRNHKNINLWKNLLRNV